MDDMVKIRYLTGKGNDRKLKRAVPKRLRNLTAKTAWVERVGKLSNLDIKRRAQIFAVQTQAEIDALERKTLELDNSQLEIEQPIRLELSDTEIEQWAIIFFWSQEEKRRNWAHYSTPDDAGELADLLADAQSDLNNDGEKVWRQDGFDNDAIELLIQANFITRPSNKLEKLKLAQELADQPSYQKLCGQSATSRLGKFET